MYPSYGFTWKRPSPLTMRTLVVALVAAILLPALVGGARLAQVGAGPLVSVIVREQPGAGSAAQQLVASLGGQVTLRLDIIDGFVAAVPEGAVADLAAGASIRSVTPNGRVRLLAEANDGLGLDASADTTYEVAKAIGAFDLYRQSITGRGVDVALIDSGVAPVDELAGRIVNGPDLSFESGADNLRYLDTFGHGTHMAGIIAGRDPAATGVSSYWNGRYATGIAPDARIVNVKVASHSGLTDVSQVIAAIDWVVQHRTDNGLNIRVLNLSFGTDGTQSYLRDPLAYAAEVAWRKGIVVVVAAGNAGFGSTALNNPAYDPFVLAVGAADMVGSVNQNDDQVASFSSRGNANRRPDLVAPGKSVVSLRDPGSYLDLAHPEARIGERFFVGSGTSQAAAVVSGAVALLLQQRPGLTPDQVKYLLTSTAAAMPLSDVLAAGAGEINVSAASKAPTPDYTQTWPPSTGTGSLELARGSVHVSDGTSTLVGEMDIFGAAWDGSTWAPAALAGNTWSGGTWNGNTWSGNTWSGNTWSGNTWSGNTWSGATWGP